MTAPSRDTIERCLRDCGCVSLAVAGKPGWVKAAYARRVAEQVEMHREDVERLVAKTPRRRRGRQPKAASRAEAPE